MALLALCAVALTAPTARADTPAAPPAPTPSAAAPSAAAPAANPDAFDFDLGDQPKQSPAETAAEKKRVDELERKVKTRRGMLVAHQAIGFTTLGVMAATLVIGQLNYVARYGGFNNGNDYDRFQVPHWGLATASSVLFTSLGILGVAAPNPYPKAIKLDSALVHKVTMALATAGMVTQLILGPITTAYEGKLSQRDLALGHLVVGYATWGFMAAGVLAYTF
ncbi:MAG: hypothetical protein U1A78_08615 [Polyangia bacterium]